MGKDLSFRIINWYVEEVKDSETIVHLSGLTKLNKQVYCKVLGFRPHCYLQLPTNVKWTKLKAMTLFTHIQKKLKECPPDSFQLETRKLDMYSLKRQFMRINFFTKNSYGHLRRCIKYPWNVPELGEFEANAFQLHEDDIKQEIKFGAQKNIDPSGWVTVKPLKLNSPDYPKNFSTCDYSIYCDSRKLKRSTTYTNDDLVDPKVCAFDIELHSVNRKSASPAADVNGNVITMVSLAFGRMSQPQEEWDVHTVSLFGCEAKQGVVYDCEGSEKKLLKLVPKIIRKNRPDVITGYNINGFDWGAILTRAKINGLIESTDAYTILPKAFQIGKLKKPSDFIFELSWGSNARGKQEKKFVWGFGILNFDFFNEVTSNYKLATYKLGFVSAHFLGGETKDDMPYQQMFILHDMIYPILKAFADGIELDVNVARKMILSAVSNDELKRVPGMVNHPADMVEEVQKATSYKKLIKICIKYWKMMVDYCVQDTILVPKLMKKLNSLTALWESSNICNVPAAFIYDRGQQIKVTAQLVKMFYNNGFVFSYRERQYDDEESSDDSESDSEEKKKKKKKKDTKKYQGGAVMKCQPGVYERVAILDFASLYPSIMMSKNMCYTTLRLLHDTRVTDDDCHIAEWDEHKGCEHDKSGKKHEGAILCGHNKYRFVKPQKDKPETIGILPQMLDAMLGKRKQVKGELKQYVKKYKELLVRSQNENLTDEERKEMEAAKQRSEILDARQLAIKVSANSMYGYTGTSQKKGTKPCEAIAASVTYFSRLFIKKSEELVCAKWDSNHKHPAEVIYGDSVSGDTPLLLRQGDVIVIKTIEELSNEWVSYDGFKPGQKGRKEKQQAYVDYESWTDNGWAKIKRVIRHKCKKDMYRVNSRFGSVDVTEDHSLLDMEKNIIKPGELTYETELLHSFPSFQRDETEIVCNEQYLFDFGQQFIQRYLEKIPQYVLNGDRSVRKRFYDGCCSLNSKFVFKHKFAAMEFFYLCKSLGKSVSVELVDGDYNISSTSKTKNIVKKIYKLERNKEDFVYDLETEQGRFHAGVGSTIVKNTDSIFTIWHGATLKETFEYAKEAAEYLTEELPERIIMEDENVYNPCLCITKKKYEYKIVDKDGNVLKEDSKGSMNTRRDNCDCARNIYTKGKNSVMDLKSMDDTVYEINEGILEMFRQRYPLKNFVIYQGLKKEIDDYVNKTGHVRLAERLRERGNDIKANTRLEYVIVKTNQKGAKSGDVMEDWNTFLTNKYVHGQQIDYAYYVEHNLVKPLTQLLNIAYPSKELTYQKHDEEFKMSMLCFLKPKWAELLKGLPLWQKAKYIMRHSRRRRMVNSARRYYSEWVLETLFKKHGLPYRYLYRHRPGVKKTTIYQNDKIMANIAKYHRWWAQVIEQIPKCRNLVRLKHRACNVNK